MNTWQIATGETGRDYSSIFIDYDIMIIGPSDYGDVITNEKKYWNGIPNSAYMQVYNFAKGPQPGENKHG